MGAPPPPNYPPPADDAAVTGDFGVEAQGEPVADICGFGIGLPQLKFGIALNLKSFGFPPPLPSPWFSFKLSCDPSNPVAIDGGLGFGAGRTPNGEPDADDDEDTA